MPPAMAVGEQIRTRGAMRNGCAVRTLASLLAAALAVFAIAACGNRGGDAEPQQAQPQQEAERQPPPVPQHERSVLLITCDTTRADHIGAYGAEYAQTPNLDRLAADGILYEQAVSVAPITLVAHTSIHTGLYPPQTGVRNNGLHRAAPELLTLAERLKARGYRTAAFVSAAVLDHQYGLDQGFEVYDDDLSSGRERQPRMVPDRPAEATVTAARAWLDELQPNEKFFIWVHFYDPHAAYSPPPPYRDIFRDRLYDGEIAYMDAQIGRLLEHPRLRGDVLVTAIADHGESLGEHGEQTHAMLLYEGTLHVPWILHVPGGPRGLRVRVPVSQVDVVPTVLELLGLPADAKLPGRSVVPPFERGEGLWQRVLYSETYLPFYTYGWAKIRSARQGMWKYVDAPGPELYDLDRDPHELSNLLDQKPSRGHDMQRDLHELMARFGDADRENAIALDSASEEQLRALGYLPAAVRDSGGEQKPRPDPKDVIGLHVDLEIANSLSERRLYDQAIRKLQSVLDRDPTNLAALTELAQAYADAGRLDDAVATTQKALALNADLPRLYLLMAGLEQRRGNLDQGLRLIDMALARDPGNVAAIIQQAVQLRRLHRRKQAEEVLAEALKSNPDEARLNVAYANLIEIPQGRLSEAEQRLRKALGRDPFLVGAWRFLGEALERQGEIEEAKSAYRKGLERKPDDADLHGQLGIILARQQDAQAEMHLREAIRLGRRFRPALHVALGAWLAEQGRLEEAEREYDLVLSRNPDNGAARNNRAIALYRTGKLAEAEKEFQTVIAEHPKMADPHNNLAAIAVEREDWKEAETQARAALALDDSLAEAWNNLGIALDQQGQAEAARQAFQASLQRDPDYWQARHDLAVNLRKAGRPQEALALFDQVLQQVPNDPEVHYELGVLYDESLGDAAQARAHFNAFLALAPADSRAAEVRQRVTALASQASAGEPAPRSR
jgi:arylsulfatase A-like enzyme/Tfp pilus assembly protein PilF